MTTQPATLFIVDDDPSVRTALGRLLFAAGYEVRTYKSAQEFLSTNVGDTPGCIILDLVMPGCDGLQLQEQLKALGCGRPIIFLTGHGDLDTGIRAMKAGAINFLTKPVDDAKLLAAVEEALEIDARQRAAGRTRECFLQRLAKLTPRERQVFDRLLTGKLNKQIAAELGTGEKTIKVHRARVMEKMGAGSVAELVQIASLAGVAPLPELLLVDDEVGES